MGGGAWSSDNARARTNARAGATQQQVFTQQGEGCAHPSTSVLGLKVRESCDSEEHPESAAVIWFLDGTGSMGDVRLLLATKILPDFMDLGLPILPDMQTLCGTFLDFHDGNGSDSLQVGQFESSDPLVDQWLTRLYFAGGGRPSESSDLAFYFAARHTAIDCWAKRGKRGYLFMCTDDTMRDVVSAHSVRELFGETATMPRDTPTAQIVREAQERYHCFVLIPDPGRARYAGTAESRWDAEGNVQGCFAHYLGAERVLVLADPSDTAIVGALLIGLTEGAYTGAQQIREALARPPFNVDGERADRIIQAIAPYAQSLGVDLAHTRRAS